MKQRDIWNSENIFHMKSDITRISKIIYQYEIYKKITNISGDIIECGVFKGNSLIRFLTYREYLDQKYSRKIYGFDVFGKFPKAKNTKDKIFLKKWEKAAGDGISQKELKDNLLRKKFENFELVKGDVTKTLPKFLKKNPKLKISLLHLDMDIYEPTKFVLFRLFNKISRGGVILLDDYDKVYGATKAVDEFLKFHKSLKIKRKNKLGSTPYIIKN